MIKRFGLVIRLIGDIDSQLLKQILIGMRKNYRRVSIASAKICKLIYSALGIIRVDGANRERDEHLIGMKSGIVVSEMLDLEMLDRLNDLGGHKMQVLIDSGKCLYSVEQHSRGGTEKL